ncbi:MAG TPA: hypothetical protein VN606_18740 [Thermoleophilaceae bacterium]|nr:hypothetical protein [Thermoleophilaceae bacterium]
MKASARTWEGEITHIGATGVAISEPSADGWGVLVCIRRVNADVLIAGSSLTVSLQQRGAPFIRRVGYESLTGVGYRPRTGWRSRETLRLGVVAEDRRQLCIDLTLQKAVDAAEVAQSIAQRAARHRLRQAPAGQRDHYAGLAVVARLPLPRLKAFAVYQLTRTTPAAPAVSSRDSASAAGAAAGP